MAISMKYVSLLLLIFMNSAQVVMVKYAGRESKYDKKVAVLMGEVIKLFLSFGLMCFERGFQSSFSLLSTQVLRHKKSVLSQCIPAILYTVQNIGMYSALKHLTPGVFQMCTRIKVLITAVLSVVILQKNLHFIQWISMVIMIWGISFVADKGNSSATKTAMSSAASSLSLSSSSSPSSSLLSPTLSIAKNLVSSTIQQIQEKESDEDEKIFLVGLFFVILSCTASSLAGVLMEKMFKDKTMSVWNRNFWLAFWSIIVNVLNLVIVCIYNNDCNRFEHPFKGFQKYAWVAILLLAVGGLVIGMVMKYADNILKAFAGSASIIVSSVASHYLFNSEINLRFCIGCILVIISILMYSYGGVLQSRKNMYQPILSTEEIAKQKEVDNMNRNNDLNNEREMK